MHISLITEATYPTAQGGVSVWCDQLIRGLSEHEFDVAAIVASGTESVVWSQPDNVTEVSLIPLWGSSAPSPKGRRADTEHFLDALELLMDVMLRPGPDDVNSFLVALKMLVRPAQSGQLSRYLRSSAAMSLVIERWRLTPLPGRGIPAGSHVPTPTVADAVTALSLIEHYLRPLAAPIPEKTDLCHSVSNGLSSLIALNAKWTHEVPFLLTEHGLYMRERYLEFRASEFSFAVRSLCLRFLRLLTSATYVEADFITPGSEYNRRWQVSRGASPDRIRSVYNGIDPSAFPAGPEPDRPTLSWAGRIAPIKDVETLISAFALVLNDIPAARLRLFGSAPPGNEGYLARCQRLVLELGLSQSVTFEGRVDQIVDAYHAGNIVALSSASEGFPYTVIEAMASGRTTVSTDVGGVREAVGDTGLVVPPRDPQAMALACIELLNDPARRLGMAQAARERALANFTLDQFLQTYRHLYPTLAHQYSRRDVPVLQSQESLIPSGDLLDLWFPRPVENATVDGLHEDLVAVDRYARNPNARPVGAHRRVAEKSSV